MGSRFEVQGSGFRVQGSGTKPGHSTALVVGLMLVAGATAIAQDLDDWDLDVFAPKSFRVGGDVKGLGILYDLSDIGLNSSEWTGLASFRLKLDGEPAPWWAYEVHAQVVQDVFSDPALKALGGATEPTSPLFRGLEGPAVWRETDTSRLWAGVDYANIRFTAGDTDFVIGRQAVTYGRSFFWNPIDWLSTFSPIEIDREYKGGVDVARVSHALSRFSGLEVLYAYGEGGHRDSSALIGRAYANWHDWDVEVLGGSVWVDNRLGAAFSGEVASAGVRGELSWQNPRDTGEDDFLRATLEVDYRWPSSLQLMAEYHYNGYGSSDPMDYLELLRSPRVTTGQVTNVGRHYGATQLSFEITPLSIGACAVLVNLDDGSGLIYPTLTYSTGDESSLTAGAVIPWGKDPREEELRSEFGAYPSTLWVQWRWSF